MTIKELIAELQKHDENIEVAFSWDSGLSSPEHPEVIEEHEKKVLVFDVSSYASWDEDYQAPITNPCICAGYTGDTHRFTCPLFGKSRKCVCLGFTHANDCPHWELPT